MIGSALYALIAILVWIAFDKRIFRMTPTPGSGMPELDWRHHIAIAALWPLLLLYCCLVLLVGGALKIGQ